MEQRGDEIHTSATEASGGSKEGVVRWVLLIGLVLVVALFAVIVMTGTLSQDEGDDSHYNVTRQINEQERMEQSRGEPIAPGYGESSASGPAAPETSETAAATPGDAPAGDPTNTAQ